MLYIILAAFFILWSVMLIFYINERKKIIPEENKTIRFIQEMNLSSQVNLHNEQTLNIIKDPIIVVSASNKPIITFANEAFIEITGYPSDQLLHTPCLNYIHPDDRKRLQKMISSSLNNDIQWNDINNLVSFRIMCLTDEYRYFEGKISEKSRDELLIVARDIHRRKFIESSLRENRRRYQYILMNFPYGIFQADSTDSKIIKTNLTLVNLLEYDAADKLEGQSLKLIFQNENIYNKFWNSLKKQDQVSDMECQLRQSSDKLIYCKISAKLIKQGTRLIINGIIHDISKQKQLEDA
ncbi:MAG: PAS domain S-box protein, partial [Candidatus Margulisbacteria bacterium]|nr:PAS domain S-box protein [Candidatus Margulisiibacteriota bacterium]